MSAGFCYTFFMQRFKESMYLSIGIIFLIWCFYTFWHSPVPQSRLNEITIGNRSIMVEIADTEAKRVRGLSGREGLPDGQGMLFVFEEAGIRGFWMKDMLFDIDIVWIDENYTVVGVEKRVSPETYPQIFHSPGAVRYVLELPAGFSDVSGIDTGSRLFLDR